jgi:hypothetical protein
MPAMNAPKHFHQFPKPILCLIHDNSPEVIQK